MKMMRNWLQRGSRILLNFVYPPLCLHCKALVEESGKVLCLACSDLLMLIELEGKCPRCFSNRYSKVRRQCQDCSDRPSVISRIGAALEYVGPASTLVKGLKYGGKPHLAKGLGAYMAAQFLRLDVELPDFIVPVPQSFDRWITRGYNQSELLGKVVGALLGCPVVSPLRRRSGDLPQAGLSYKKRMDLPLESFQLKSNVSIADKNILLIDDVLTTGATLRRCAEVLAGGHPANIYALAACGTQ